LFKKQQNHIDLTAVAKGAIDLESFIPRSSET